MFMKSYIPQISRYIAGILFMASVFFPFKVYAVDFSSICTPSDSSHYNSSYTGANAFDGNSDPASAAWASSTGSNPRTEWIKCALSSPKTLDSVDYYPETDRVGNFKIQGSNDDYSWVDLFSGTSDSVHGIHSLTINDTTGYLYYRMYITSTITNPTEVAIFEIKFYGSDVSSNSPTPVPPTPTFTPTPSPTTSPNPTSSISWDNVPTYAVPTPIDYSGEYFYGKTFFGSGESLDTNYPEFSGSSLINVDNEGIFMLSGDQLSTQFSWSSQNWDSNTDVHFAANIKLGDHNTDVIMKIGNETKKGQIHFSYNTTSNSYIATVCGNSSNPYSPLFNDNGFHEWGVVINATNSKCLLSIDGKFVQSVDNNTQTLNSTPTFYIDVNSANFSDFRIKGLRINTGDYSGSAITAEPSEKICKPVSNIFDFPNMICIFNENFTKILIKLFVPNFSSGFLSNQINDIKSKLSTKFPLGYVFFWVNYDWESVFNSIPASSDTQFSYPIHIPGTDGSSNFDLSFDLAPSGQKTTDFIAWTKDGIGFFLLIPLLFGIYRIVLSTFNITNSLKPQTDDTVDYNEWQNTHR